MSRTTQIVLLDGRSVQVRPIAAADRAALAAAVARLSPESRYRRFLGAVDELSPKLLAYFTEIDHHNHEALVALDGGEIVGVARYVRSPPGARTAELAVAIADAWQSDGLGTALVAALIDRARAEGIEAFNGAVLGENQRMLELLRECGAPHVAPADSGVEDFVLPLPSTAMTPRIPELLAHAAEHARRSGR